MAPLEAINMKKLNMVTKVKNTDQHGHKGEKYWPEGQMTVF